jgi:hypothetical protein
MADEIDAMLDGQETPAPVSQTQNGSQIDASDDDVQSEEEVEFNKLTGSTQERIRQLANSKREMAEKIAGYENMLRTVPPPAPQVIESNPDIQTAVQKLDNVGIATKDYTDQRISQSLSALRYEQEMNRLASIYDGKDNKPSFDRVEYEEFVRDNPVYANYFPEDTFKMKMFSDEFSSSSNDGIQTVNESKTLKPTKTSQHKESFTPEYIEDKLKSLPAAEREQWYGEHLSEINATLGKMNP